MYTQDQPGGGTADRAHVWGSAPYGEPYKVPALSHYFHDILPFHHCCIWTDYNYERWYLYKFYYNCRWYLEARNTTGCDRYESPGPAYVFGDPHFRTFNNSQYTFNGKGEYRLLECDYIKFRMHGLFTQGPNNTYGTINATGLEAVAVKEGTRGSVVEIRVNLPTCRWRNRLQIIVDNQEVLFNSSLNKWQWFTNLSIFSETDNKENTNLTLMFPSGTGVQVVESYGYLHVYVSASPWFYKRTEGLFGYWDSIEENDLILPSTKVDADVNYKAIQNKEPKYLFKYFGLYWRIESERESVLTRPVGRNFTWIHLSYNLRDFYPIFGMPELPWNTTLTEAEVQSTCRMINGEPNRECEYDYKITARKEVAISTKLQTYWWNDVYESMKPVNSCGVLPFRGDWDGAVRFPRSYMAGENIKASCKPGYDFWGQSTWRCNSDGKWEGVKWGVEEEWPMCLSVRHHVEYALYVGAGVLGFFLILITAICIVVSRNSTAPPRTNPFRQDDSDDDSETEVITQSMSAKEKLRMKEKEKESSSTLASSGQQLPGQPRIPSVSASVGFLSTGPGIYSNIGADMTPNGSPEREKRRSYML